MKKFRLILISAVVFGVFTNLSCTADEANKANNNSQNNSANSSNNNSNIAKDDTEELEVTIKLPFHPQDAVWREDNLATQDGDNRIPAPTDKKLTAVLKFAKADADKIVEQAAKHLPPAQVSLSTEPWFPAELIAQSQISGDETLKGTSYSAKDFLQMPYSEGRIIRIEGTDYFIVELMAK